MAEKPKRRRRIFGPLTYGVLVVSALVYLGFRLEPWVHKQLRCRTLLHEMRTATGSNRWDKEQKLKDLIDPSTRYWVDDALLDNDPRIRLLAYSVITQAYPEPSQAYPRLSRAFSDPVAGIRIAAVNSISEYFHSKHNNIPEKCIKKIIKAIDPLLNHNERSIRLAGLDCLMRFPRGFDAIEEAMASMIDDPDVNIKIIAIKKINSFNKISSRVKKLLESKLEERDRSVRFAAAATLARFETERSRKIDRLQAALRRPDHQETNLNGYGVISKNDEYEIALQSLVEQLGAHETIDFFIEMMRDSDPRVRVNGVEGLWFLGHYRPQLVVRNGSSGLRSVDITSDLFDDDRISALVLALDDTDLRVAFAAAATLSSDKFMMYHDQTKAIDRVLRSVIANRRFYKITRSFSCELLIRHSEVWNKDLENFILTHLDRNDSEISYAILDVLSRRGSWAKPAIPFIVKLDKRYPLRFATVQDVLKKIDPAAAEKHLMDKLQFNKDEFIEDEVPVDTGDEPIPKNEE